MLLAMPDLTDERVRRVEESVEQSPANWTPLRLLCRNSRRADAAGTQSVTDESPSDDYAGSVSSRRPVRKPFELREPVLERVDELLLALHLLQERR
jgi:hypothetical protein